MISKHTYSSLVADALTGSSNTGTVSFETHPGVTNDVWELLEKLHEGEVRGSQ
jgi:hypothetical protein